MSASSRWRQRERGALVRRRVGQLGHGRLHVHDARVVERAGGEQPLAKGAGLVHGGELGADEDVIDYMPAHRAGYSHSQRGQLLHERKHGREQIALPAHTLEHLGGLERQCGRVTALKRSTHLLPFDRR